MKTLTIKDLAVTEQLGHKEMAAVRGGMFKGYLPYVWLPSYSSSSKTSVDASQSIGQIQDVASINGNNVAFATDIHSTVKPTQTASNNITLF